MCFPYILHVLEQQKQPYEELIVANHTNPQEKKFFNSRQFFYEAALVCIHNSSLSLDLPPNLLYAWGYLKDWATLTVHKRLQSSNMSALIKSLEWKGVK